MHNYYDYVKLLSVFFQFSVFLKCIVVINLMGHFTLNIYKFEKSRAKEKSIACCTSIGTVT